MSNESRSIPSRPQSQDIQRSWSAPGYRHANLSIDGKEIEFSPDQVLDTWLFFGEILGLAWSKNEGPLDMKPGEIPPITLYPEMSQWTAVRLRREAAGQDQTEIVEKAVAITRLKLRILDQIKMEVEATGKLIASADVTTMLIDLLVGHVASSREKSRSLQHMVTVLVVEITAKYAEAHRFMAAKEAREGVAG